MAWGQPDEAIALFDEAIELKPDFAKAYNEKGTGPADERR